MSKSYYCSHLLILIPSSTSHSTLSRPCCCIGCIITHSNRPGCIPHHGPSRLHYTSRTISFACHITNHPICMPHHESYTHVTPHLHHHTHTSPPPPPTPRCPFSPISCISIHIMYHILSSLSVYSLAWPFGHIGCISIHIMYHILSSSSTSFCHVPPLLHLPLLALPLLSHRLHQHPHAWRPATAGWQGGVLGPGHALTAV